MGEWSISEELAPWLEQAFALAGLTMEERQKAGPHLIQHYVPFQIAEALLKASNELPSREPFDLKQRIYELEAALRDAKERYDVLEREREG